MSSLAIPTWHILVGLVSDLPRSPARPSSLLTHCPPPPPTSSSVRLPPRPDPQTTFGTWRVRQQTTPPRSLNTLEKRHRLLGRPRRRGSRKTLRKGAEGDIRSDVALFRSSVASVLSDVSLARSDAGLLWSGVVSVLSDVSLAWSLVVFSAPAWPFFCPTWRPSCPTHMTLTWSSVALFRSRETSTFSDEACLVQCGTVPI